METTSESKLPSIKKKTIPSLDEQHMHEIISSVFLGDLESSQDGNKLKVSKITHMVDLANTVELDQSQRGKKNFEMTIHDESCDWVESCPCIKSKLFINVDDTEEGDIGEHFDIINEYIKKALLEEGGVLVHCVRGKSRSAAAVVQYLMQILEYTLRAAMRTVYQGRPGVAINPGFKNQLQKLEAKLRPGEPPSVILKVASKKPTLSRHSTSPSSSTVTSVKTSNKTHGGGGGGIDTDDSTLLAKSPNTAVRKLPPFSPSSPDGSGGGTIAVQEEVAVVKEEAPTYCTLTMRDALPDIRAEAKRLGLNEKGTKKQVLNRIIEKLGTKPTSDNNNEVNNNEVNNNVVKGNTSTIPIQQPQEEERSCSSTSDVTEMGGNSTEGGGGRVKEDTDNGRKGVNELVDIKKTQMMDEKNATSPVFSPLISEEVQSTNEMTEMSIKNENEILKQQPHNNNNDNKMPPISSSSSSSPTQKTDQSVSNEEEGGGGKINLTNCNKMPPISLSPNSQKRAEELLVSDQNKEIGNDDT